MLICIKTLPLTFDRLKITGLDPGAGKAPQDLSKNTPARVAAT